MMVGMSEGEPIEDRARNRESRRKAAPERGLVPREWNTDQYQEPRRELALPHSVQLLRPSEISSCLGAFDENARERKDSSYPLTPGDLIETTSGRKRNGSALFPTRLAVVPFCS